MRLLFEAAAAILMLAACDAPAADKAETPAAAAPASAPEPAAPAASSAADAEREKMARMTEVAADEAAFSEYCVSDGQLDKTVCDCVGKQTVKTLGAKGLYRWVWEGYVSRDGTAQMRSRKWFTDNGVDIDAQKKFVAAVGTCYVTQ